MSNAQDTGPEVRRFVEEHPQGWGHEDWLEFLHRLYETGHEIPDPDGLGLAVERERLVQVLDRIELKGLGPKRREALTNHFGSLYDLCSTDSEHIARLTGIPRSLAEEVSRTLR
jgi:hypothetical protein